MEETNFHLENSDRDSEMESQNLQQLNSVLDPDGRSSSTPTSPLPSSSASEIRKIDIALSLNKQLDDKFQRLETLLTARLQVCDRMLNDIAQSKRSTERADPLESFNCVRFGRPYFIDKFNCTPPDNEDTISIKKLGMCDFNAISSAPDWTFEEKSEFLQALLRKSKEIKRKEIDRKISELKCAAERNPSERIENNIALLIKERENIENKLLKDIALPINEEYDWELISNKLNYCRTAGEYRSLWKLLLHPSINKSDWTESEQTALQKIAIENKYQNWDDIALKLGTNRTGYQCFVYFRRNKRKTHTEEAEEEGVPSSKIKRLS